MCDFVYKITQSSMNLMKKNKLNDSTKKILSNFFLKMSSIEDDKPFIDESSNNSLCEAYIRPLGL